MDTFFKWLSITIVAVVAETLIFASYFDLKKSGVAKLW